MKKGISLLLIMSLFTVSSFVSNAAGTTEITEDSSSQSADVTVSVDVGSQFTVGIPTAITLSKSGTANYKITILGDLNPLEELHVVPADEDSSTNGTQMKLTEQGRLTGAQTRLLNVTQSKTKFSYSDINLTTPYEVTCSLATTDGNALKAGKWQGILTYNISLKDKD